MKVNMWGYEVEVKAKTDGKNRFNEGDTQRLIHDISTMCLIMSDMYEKEGKERLYRIYQERWSALYDQLDNAGYYDTVK